MGRGEAVVYGWRRADVKQYEVDEGGDKTI